MNTENKSQHRQGLSVRTTPKKVVRDNFSMPAQDYALIEEMRERLIRDHNLARNKSEVLRAGLLALAGMNRSELAEAIARVQVLKPGRKSSS